MIKTTSMAELVRPKPRKSKKKKVASPETKHLSENVTETEREQDPKLSSEINEEIQQGDGETMVEIPEGQKTKNEECLDMRIPLQIAGDDNREGDDVGAETERKNAEATSPDESESSEQIHVIESDSGLVSSKEMYPSAERPNSLQTPLAKTIETISTEETCLYTQFKTLDVSGESSVIPSPVIESHASHLDKHQSSLQEHHLRNTEHIHSLPSALMTGGPMVVEDPDTPMSRTTSPPPITNVPPDIIKTPSPTIPTIVQEEKSPTLLAQEALARNITSQISSQTTGIKPSSPVSSHTASSIPTCPAQNAQSPTVECAAVDQFNAASVRFLTRKGELPSQPQVKSSSPYSVVQAEQEKLSPRVKLGAMTLQELLALYYNPQLAHNDKFVDEFVLNEKKRERHEFAEILSNYHLTCHQLLGVKEDLKSLHTNYVTLQQELWIVHSKSVVAQGQCADQAKVTATHTYEQCELNKEAVSKMAANLDNTRTLVADNLSLFAYTAQISKLQVESYIHELFVSSPVLRDIPKNASVQVRQHIPPDEEYQIQKLKDCITILFMFHRRPSKDIEFIKNIQHWTVRMASSLLRVATFSDHLFILNHILRCPHGMGRWAANLVQFPTPNISQHEPNFGGTVLNHMITSLATVLLPTRAREEFLYQMRPSLSAESMQEDRAWILVDSDGEEDEDPENSWLYLHENDIVAILNQFPLAEIFSNILLATVSESGHVDYDVSRSSEPMMIRMFAFSTVLVQLLGTGLSTYSMARYRQLNKRLGQLIKQTVSFVSDHWLNFKTFYGPLAPLASMESLQLEFDQLFMRATYSILTAQKLGSWQFMADMPYTCVSMASMWQLLWVLHQGQGHVINLDSLPPVESCKENLENPDSWQQLADNLMHMSTSEAIYLLTTFANMASCRSSEEQGFIQTITLGVFEIAYICSHTREFCSKVGRELLSGIIQTHPSALSCLLVRVKDVLSKIGKMALYLFHGLPVSIWQPTDPDMLILRQWLLHFDLLSIENQIARIIFGKINWDVFEEAGRLVVDIRLHRQMALLLVEAYTRFIADKRAGFFIMEGMKQMASYVTSSPTAEQTFNNWVWNLVVQLKLHQRSLLLYALDTASHSFQVPNLGADHWLTPLLKGTVSKTPIACYVALTMTNIGHDVTSFISEGLDMLLVLTNNYQYTTAIHVIGCILPMFIDDQQYLLGNVKFIQVMQSLLAADESLYKSTKSTIVTVPFPGIVTQQLTEMIQALVTSHLSLGKGDQVIIFWMRCIFKVSTYFTDRNSCFVANTLIQWCFVKKGVVYIFADIFKENFVEFCSAFKSRQGLVSSMVNWIATSSSSTQPSFMESSSMAEFPWLAFIILLVEGEMEVNSRLWQTLIMELHSPSKPNVEAALRTAVAKLNLEQYPTASRLTIYRWAQQALDTPYDHPVLPILWQRFFALFLGRQLFESGLAQRASVGERFFESTSYSHMLKKMRKRLKETSTFHMNFDPQAHNTKKRKSLSPGTPPDDLARELGASASHASEEDLDYSSSMEFHQMLARLYQTFSLWLEEPRLHDGNLYLPALPPQYEAARLNQVFQGFMSPWIEFMDLEGLQYNLSCLAADWRKYLSCVKTPMHLSARNSQYESGNATERISRRLRSYDPPRNPPPIETIQSAVPFISVAMVEDQDALMHLIMSDLQVLINYTKVFSARLAQHCALDLSYVEIIPSTFSNVTKTIPLTASCKSMVNPLHKCTNPAVMPVTISVMERNEVNQSKVDRNRVEHKQIMIETLMPTALNICVAAVHTENAITLLIKQSQTVADVTRLDRLNDTACQLFFHMAQMVSQETNFHPPTKQFFASCLDILGQEFVSRSPAQMERVLQLCLDKPLVSGTVSPHFVPNSCPELLVAMYGRLLHVLQNQDMDLVFMLLTKFDICHWLESSNPSRTDRQTLVEFLGSAIMACGAETGAESKLIFGLYLEHLTCVLVSNFPSNLYDVINMVLQGSASDHLHTKVWEILLKVCFSDDILLRDMRQRKDSVVFESERVEKALDIQLSMIQVKELLDWFSSFFMQDRMTLLEAAASDFYTKWNRYVPYIALMVGGLCRSFITKVIVGSEDTMTPFQIMEILWQPLTLVCSPWIQPHVAKNGKAVPPWLESDCSLALVMVSTFRKSASYIYQLLMKKHPTAAGAVLSSVLMYYMNGLCSVDTPAYVVDIYVSELLQLPWRQLCPDMKLMEAMTRVKQVSSPCCYSLIGSILPQVQWRDVIGYCVSHQHPELTAQMQAALAVLLIQSYVDPIYREEEETGQLLSEAEKFDWSMVSPEGCTCVCNWFIQLCDPKCVLAQRSSTLALGLRLLKQISGFHINTQWNEHVSIKRLTYLHCITQELCQVTYLNEVDPEAVNTAIVNLLSEVEAVESTVPSASSQAEESKEMLKDILSLLNNSNPEGPWLDNIMSSLTGWLRASPKSLLLVPCMRAASRCLASLRQMAAVVETGIEIYFIGVDPTNCGTEGWDFILSVFEVPQLNQAGYVQDSLTENAFLVLYVYLKHRLALCRNIADEHSLMEEILDWTIRAHPSSENEDKLVLWWHFLLTLALQQIQRGSMPVTGIINLFSRFVNHLNQWGQERATKGLLGAIGLGRKSVLSFKMRMLARALSAFLTTQIVNLEFLRIHPATRLSAQSTLSELNSLKKLKTYSSLTETIDRAGIFIQDTNHTFVNALEFLSLVVKGVYPEKNYLYAIIKNVQ